LPPPPEIIGGVEDFRMRRKELKAILPESNGCRQYGCELTEWQR